MKCPSITELKDCIGGIISSEKMLEILAHIRGCEACRDAVSGLVESKVALRQLEQQILACACPDYEELSAYVDGTLTGAQVESVRGHLCSCERCSEDVDTLRAQRSHASLVPRVAFSPGRTVRVPAWRYWVPRLAPAAGALAAAAIIAFMVLSGHGRVNLPATTPTIVTQNTPVHQSAPDAEDQAVPKPAPATDAVKPTPDNSVTVSPEQPTPPREAIEPRRTPRVVATADVSRDLSQLQATADQIDNIRRAVSEKLQTGTLTADAPVRMAMANTLEGVRYPRLTVGPEPVSPVMATVLHGDLTLKWRHIDGAEEYRVELTDAQGKVIMSAKTNDTRLTVDSSKIGVGGGILIWRAAVRLGSADIWESGKASVVRMLSNDDSRLVRKAAAVYPKDHLLLGAIYELHGLYPQAEREFRRLSASPKPPQNASKMLSTVRDKM